jgi:ketosteroid isomerase-like protein
MILSKNLILIEKMLAAFNNHDIEQMVEFLDEDALDYLPSQKEPLKGRAAIQKDNEEFISLMPDDHFEITHLFGQDDWICAEGIITGTNKGQDNKSIRIPGCMVVKFEASKVKEIHEYLRQVE